MHKSLFQVGKVAELLSIMLPVLGISGPEAKNHQEDSVTVTL